MPNRLQPLNVDIKDPPTSTGPINIYTTPITDGTNTGYLSSLIKKVNTDNKLVVNSYMIVSDGTNEAAFDYEYDEDGDCFGAGTAFLQD